LCALVGQIENILTIHGATMKKINKIIRNSIGPVSWFPFFGIVHNVGHKCSQFSIFLQQESGYPTTGTKSAHKLNYLIWTCSKPRKYKFVSDPSKQAVFS